MEQAKASRDVELRQETSLTPAQLREAAALFARFFVHNPLFVDWFPDRVRNKALTAMFEAVFRDGLRHGRVDLVHVGGKLVGGVVWYEPGGFPMSTSRMLRLTPAYLRIGSLAPKSVPKILKTQHTLDKLHPKEPHHYLFFGGVDDEYQHTGVGRLILKSILEDADARGLPCYLETQEGENAAWYARHGFATIHEGLETAPGSPPSWTMWRPARAASVQPQVPGDG